MPHGRSDVSISDLLDLGILQPGQELRLRGRGDGKATVGADGELLVAGKRYGSPSTAANSILGRHSNGWFEWSVRHGKEWIPLDKLRQQARES